MKIHLSFNLGLFSQYRSELMGVAALFIIVCHAPAFGVQMPRWMSTVIGNGGLGVDIFLFLSGMGIYNSYMHNCKSGHSLLYWLFKRYIRIIIPLALIIMPIRLCLPNAAYHTSTFLMEICGFGALFGKSPLWFISCILVLYVLTPLFAFVLHEKRKVLWLVLLSFLFFSIAYMPPRVSIWHFMMNRWPSYLLGFTLAPDIKEQKSGSFWLFVFIPMLVYILLYTINNIFSTHFSLFWLQGVFVMTICAVLVNKHRKTNVFLSFMGAISLESYITNEYVLRLLSKFSWTINGTDVNPGNWTFYIFGSFVCIALSYIVNKYSKLITRKIN